VKKKDPPWAKQAAVEKASRVSAWWSKEKERRGRAKKMKHHDIRERTSEGTVNREETKRSRPRNSRETRGSEQRHYLAGWNEEKTGRG